MTDRKDVIFVRGKSPRYNKSAAEFIERVVELAKDGYVPHPRPIRSQMPTFIGFPRCTMVTKEHAAEILAAEKANQEQAKEIETKIEETAVAAKEAEKAAEVSDDNKPDEFGLTPEVEAQAEATKIKAALDRLESLDKRDDLLELAKELNIEIPKLTVMPKSIKKVIKDSLTNTE